MDNKNYTHVITIRGMPRQDFNKFMDYLENIYGPSSHDHYIRIGYTYSNEIGREGTLVMSATKDHAENFRDAVLKLFALRRGD